ncbi:phosphoglycerate mutase-like protein [Pisolithus orientalis]|uniref:phosphoglycerate mutase-like protein n=1 Tax=Pisolithus orientalis TaxID=936130 RepID=UPI002225761A|nr:phosphoglycerate mutase-like protein [Pisolithus orientalis]KAI6006206.1 phosphoglycerate mutase-like protein [Pisolithus orientalis]
MHTRLGLEGLDMFKQDVRFDAENYTAALLSQTTRREVTISHFDKVKVRIDVEKDKNTQRGRVKMALTSVYNASITPSSLPWDTYNYCNAPHANPDHYSLPNESGARLRFVVVVMQHHKLGPFLVIPQSYAGGTAQIFTETSIPFLHPFADCIWAGTCNSGQLTREGLDDATKHGRDFLGVYHERLGFLEHPRTQQVAGAMLYGMDPNTASKQWPVYMQPNIIDSLVLNYACPVAGQLRAEAQAMSSWVDHLAKHESLQRRLDETLGTTGLDAWNSWYDHFDIFTSRPCQGHPLPCSVTGACVSPEDAKMVFSIGDWEYKYLFNDGPQASQYVKLAFGVFFAELANTLRHVSNRNSSCNGGEENLRDNNAHIGVTSHVVGAQGRPKHKLHMYVGHDGSMVRLAAGLGLGRANCLRWSAMSSEIVMEQDFANHISNRCDRFGDVSYVRVLREGSPAPPPLDRILGEFI